MIGVRVRLTFPEELVREPEATLRATFEFATAPEAGAVVRTIHADCKPGGLVVLVPPNLATK